MTIPAIKLRRVYCFDTSAFVMLSRTSENIIELPKELWAHLEKMMREGEIISHEIVFAEINSGTKDPDFITKWVADKKDSFLKKTHNQVVEVSKIVKQFPGLIDSDAEHEQADPWIIALAIEKCKDRTLFQDCECIVVSQESQKSSKKIPAVCSFFNIKHFSLKDFFTDIGLTTQTTLGKA